MPRDVTSEFIEEKNKRTNEPVFLYTIFDYDTSGDSGWGSVWGSFPWGGGGANLYFAEYNTDVTFDGQIYTKFPITHDVISENINGQIDQIVLRLSNVSRLIQSYLENYDWRGKKIEIKLVWSDQLSDVNNFMSDTFYIDSYGSDQNDATFVLTSKFDIINEMLPHGAYSRNYCRYKHFKGLRCAYSGPETTCDRRLSTCRDYDNVERFGGQPSVPGKRSFSG